MFYLIAFFLVMFFFVTFFFLGAAGTKPAASSKMSCLATCALDYATGDSAMRLPVQLNHTIQP